MALARPGTGARPAVASTPQTWRDGPHPLVDEQRALADFPHNVDLKLGGRVQAGETSRFSSNALVAIGFRTYNPDTARVFPAIAAPGVPSISMTDRLLSPTVAGATVVFEIPDMPEPSPRTMVAPMCLAQTLVAGLTRTAD